MYYVAETSKSFDQAAADLEAAIVGNGFGVLHVHDIGATLRSKGVAFERECKVFEVCNPRQAARVLAVDMRLNMALPCRVSVYTEAGGTRIGMIEPVAMLATLSADATLTQVAREVQAVVAHSIDEAR
ncbi:DUF302 domain-containing protein [Rhodanobacter lindaniclasticus]